MKSEIKDIFNLQKEYFKSGETLSLEFRRIALLKLKGAIISNEEEIIDALKKDLGKPLLETYTSEIGFILLEINTMLKNMKNWLKPKRVKSSILDFPAKSYVIKEPYGTSLIIGPWNFPLQLTLVPLVGAIATGNTAIIKPSEISSHSSGVIRKIINSTFDRKYIWVKEGGVDVVTELQDLPFNKIFFTGSPEIGKIVMRNASKHLSNVTLELGGKNPCIIDKNVNLEVTVKRILFGKFMNNGQVCVAPDYVFVHESLRDKFLDLLKLGIDAFYGKDIRKSKDYGRIISKKHFNRLVDIYKNEEVLHGGDCCDKSLYIEPTVIAVRGIDSPALNEEIFGPMFPVISYKEIDDIYSFTDKNPDPLALYIFSNNKKLINKVIKRIPSGGVCINDTVSQIMNHNLPFGGRGSSGLGSYHGKHSIEAFSHKRAFLKKSLKFDISQKYPPYGDFHNKIRKFLVR